MSSDNIKKDEILSRRQFFNRAFSKSKEVVTEIVKERVKLMVRREALRPPGACSEAEFLLSCTRCGDCVSACPPKAIHLMEEATGLMKNTPFIDVEEQACIWCEDFPCIESCEPGALKKQAIKPIGRAIFVKEHCLEAQGVYSRCGYCYKTCPTGVSAIEKGPDGLPAIDGDECVGCGKCAYMCVSTSGPAIVVEPVD